MSLQACGPAPPIDVGTDYSQVDLDDIVGEQEASPDGIIPSVPRLPSSFEVAPACQDGFQACGGLLAGTWIVEETCNSETLNRKALQIWGQTFMPLDSGSCLDAVQSVKSRWEGDLSFEKGVAIDTRVRHDMIEMNLSRDCLNATFGVNIQAEKIPALCSALSKDSTSCTAVNGACRCSSRRENMVSYSGGYGVDRTQVGIKTKPGEPLQMFEYCVREDQLFWREPTSARFVVLRRQGAIPDETDPPEEVLR